MIHPHFLFFIEILFPQHLIYTSRTVFIFDNNYSNTPYGGRYLDSILRIISLRNDM